MHHSQEASILTAQHFHKVFQTCFCMHYINSTLRRPLLLQLSIVETQFDAMVRFRCRPCHSLVSGGPSLARRQPTRILTHPCTRGLPFDISLVPFARSVASTQCQSRMSNSSPRAIGYGQETAHRAHERQGVDGKEREVVKRCAAGARIKRPCIYTPSARSAGFARSL